jgi:flagellin-like hook-associated protein FlgL
LQTQILTGNRINTPSDDPVGANTALELQNLLEKTARYSANVDTGTQSLGLTETALKDLSDILNQAKTLMLQQVGSTGTAETRNNAAISIDGMPKEAISIANRKFGNTYLFGGTQTGTAPFSEVGAEVRVIGGEEIGGYLDSIRAGGENDMFNDPGNAARIVDAAINDVSDVRAYLGAFVNDTIDPNISSLNIAIENLVASESEIRDWDFASETAEYTRAQILFQAGISVLSQANIIPQSVLKLLQ